MNETDPLFDPSAPGVAFAGSTVNLARAAKAKATVGSSVTNGLKDRPYRARARAAFGLFQGKSCAARRSMYVSGILAGKASPMELEEEVDRTAGV
jgi:hypothetical protein